MEHKAKVLSIVGTTASGKTSLAIKLAQQFAGEVISADSRQVYRGLDIGSGKVTVAEMQGVPHHLLDVVAVGEPYTAADFKRDARAAIADITNRQKLPIIAGGTFFYVDTLLGRVAAPSVAPNPPLRAKLEALSNDELYAELRERDSQRAANIDPHNKRRLIRALEIVATLGFVPPLSSESPYKVLSLGIKRDKEELRVRFRARAEDWLEAGFMAEIESLLESSVDEATLQEIGFEYTLGIALFRKEITTEEYLDRFVEKNWQYAKQQLTWLKRDESIVWIDITDINAVTKLVADWLSS